MRQTFIWCRTSFIGFHFWKDAPDKLAYLRVPHRHVFHVEVQVNVSHHDRQIEFHLLKKLVDEVIADWSMGTQELAKPYSCERMAGMLLDTLTEAKFDTRQVSVSEDGENGATVCQ